MGALAMFSWMRAAPMVSLPEDQTQSSATSSAREPGTGTRTTIEDEQLRRIVREELARHAASLGVAPGATSPPADGDARAAVSPQSFASAERAHAVLDGAVSRLVWTADDASAFSAELGSMHPAQRAELLQKFAVAVNERGMKLLNAGPPF